jgi:hypothetical protein
MKDALEQKPFLPDKDWATIVGVLRFVNGCARIRITLANPAELPVSYAMPTTAKLDPGSSPPNITTVSKNDVPWPGYGLRPEVLSPMNFGGQA